MSGASELSLAATPWSLIASLAVILITAAIGYLTWLRSDYSLKRGVQELLRLAIVGLAALLLNQPEWVQSFQPDSEPTVVVLWDNSPSMQTQDVVAPPASKSDQGNSNQIKSSQRGTPTTRATAMEPLIDPALWNRDSAAKRQVLVQPINGQPIDIRRTDSNSNGRSVDATKSDRRGTDLSQPLLEIADSVDSLLAIVLISDGDWNQGASPVTTAASLKLQGVPVHSVAVGSESRLPDIELSSLDAPTFAIAEKPVRIPFTVENALPTELVVTAQLEVSTGTTLKREIRIAPLGKSSEAFTWTPQATGDYTLTVSIPVSDAETIRDNNSRSAPISVRRERLKVLIVESYPRWEYRYLRNALSRDPGVEVSCLLFQSGLQKVGGGSIDYIPSFPESIEELSKYDVVFVGDVGTEIGQLDETQCANLAGLVQQQASGLVFIPGMRGRQFDLLDTKLSELMPVVLDPGQANGWGARVPGKFELTERGRRSLLTRLSESDNEQVWEDLPGFQWYAPVIRAKAGSEVLAVHQEITNEYGRLPLLVTRTFGTGKVLFMGTDGAWRWRMGVEDKYHYRFWGQVVRWMAYQRNMAAGESIRFIYSPDQPELGQVIALQAHVADDTGEPLQSGEVVVMMELPSGATETVRLRSTGGPWGTFEGSYEPREVGEHQVQIAAEKAAATLDAKFYVQGQTFEPIGKPARPDVLQEISQITGGVSVPPERIESIINCLADLPDPEPVVRRLQIWSHPVTAALLITLMGAFWIWRKATGLI